MTRKTQPKPDSSQTVHAYAAYCTQGYPRPFIHPYHVAGFYREVMKSMGTSWASKGETWRHGWQLAKKHGWRIRKVKVSLADTPEKGE